ncbi:helical backbone metal receptor [Yersinia entomophaga]|uniref:helical backbone metal receptor n=1 Tax=Yersinia entomophaga TaxID=935293 RepID=UPI00211B6028|nr:helical backbone metal receptor [Yersinia entomophaga]
MTIPALGAERIISLAPSTTELAYAAGLGDKLVAVSDYSDYPEAAKKLEHVASWQGINVEKILALKPDLILAWRGGNAQRPLDQLASFGIPIFYSDPTTIEQIADDLDKLAGYSLNRKKPIRQRSKFGYAEQSWQNIMEKISL